MYKTIYFYKLDIKEFMKNTYYPESSFSDIFNNRIDKEDIVKNTDSLWGDFLSYNYNNLLIIDILEYKKEYLFGTLGSPKNEKKMTRIRNIKDMSHVDLKDNDELAFEDYTYFYMDYSVGIISVLNLKGTPNIRALTKIFSDYPIYDPHIYPIKNTNVFGKLNQVTELGGIEMKFNLSPDELLGCNGSSAPMSLIKKFKDNGFDSFRIGFFMNSKENRENNYKKAMENVLDTYKLVKDNNEEDIYKLEQLDLRASFDDEKQESINLLELYFTKGINIKVDNDFSEKKIKVLLISAYNSIKNDIFKSISLH